MGFTGVTLVTVGQPQLLLLELDEGVAECDEDEELLDEEIPECDEDEELLREESPECDDDEELLDEDDSGGFEEELLDNEDDEGGFCFDEDELLELLEGMSIFSRN